MSVQLTMIAIIMMMMMCCTSVQLSVASGQQSTEAEIYASRDELEAVIQETEQLRTTLGAVIEGLAEKLETQNTHIKKQNEAIERLQLENIDMKQHIEGQNDINEKLKHQVENLISHPPRHDDDADQVAFSVVSHTPFGPVEVDTNIPFEIIHTNRGGLYSPVSNACQIYVAGVYMFMVSVKGHQNSPTHAWVHLTHSHAGGQTRVASMIANGGIEGTYWSDGDANAVILELAQGDIVSVQLRAGNGYLNSLPASVYSTFSGYRLFS